MNYRLIAAVLALWPLSASPAAAGTEFDSVREEIQSGAYRGIQPAYDSTGFAELTATLYGPTLEVESKIISKDEYNGKGWRHQTDLRNYDVMPLEEVSAYLKHEENSWPYPASRTIGLKPKLGFEDKPDLLFLRLAREGEQGLAMFYPGLRLAYGPYRLLSPWQVTHGEYDRTRTATLKSL